MRDMYIKIPPKMRYIFDTTPLPTTINFQEIVVDLDQAVQLMQILDKAIAEMEINERRRAMREPFTPRLHWRVAALRPEESIINEATLHREVDHFRKQATNAQMELRGLRHEMLTLCVGEMR